MENPFFGGGMHAIQNNDVWKYYTTKIHYLSFIPTPPPDPYKSHAAHSIYFQVLGDAGFVGLGIFTAILLRAWFSCGKLMRQTAKVAELRWIHDLALAMQVSLVAYGVAGAALNMAYFEMFYVFVVLIAIQEQMVKKYLNPISPSVRETSSRDMGKVDQLASGRVSTHTMNPP
jgi:probable O-glycosylation ligase (exosortase A-associated)